MFAVKAGIDLKYLTSVFSMDENRVSTVPRFSGCGQPYITSSPIALPVTLFAQKEKRDLPHVSLSKWAHMFDQE